MLKYLIDTCASLFCNSYDSYTIIHVLRVAPAEAKFNLSYYSNKYHIYKSSIKYTIIYIYQHLIIIYVYIVMSILYTYECTLHDNMSINNLNSDSLKLTHDDDDV